MLPAITGATPLDLRYMPEPNSGCWLWLGAMSSGGYGYFRAEPAHRVVYEAERGPIPEGMWIDHLCRNPSCVNPDHLEPVSPGENTRRGTSYPPNALHNKMRSHCPKGHPYTGDNLYRQGKQRACRECGRIRAREYQRRKRLAAA